MDLSCADGSDGKEGGSDNDAATQDLILKVDRFTNFIEFKKRQFGDIDEVV